MNDTFANNKVYEDDRWLWGDQREKRKISHETTKQCLFPFFWPPIWSSKKLENNFFDDKKKVFREENGP